MKILNRLKRLILSPEAYGRSLGVVIGKNCRIAICSWGSEPYLIRIGDHVHVTDGVRFVNHDGGVWVFREEDPTFDVFGKISIGDNTYLGNNATIMPGVSIGKNCVIGANSVVTKSIPDNSVVAGIPAKYLMHVKEYRQKLEVLSAATKAMNSSQKRQYLLSLEEDRFIKKRRLNINDKE